MPIRNESEDKDYSVNLRKKVKVANNKPVRADELHTLEVAEEAPATAAASGDKSWLEKDGSGAAIGAAGTMVGQTIDPKAEGSGAMLSGAAQGAAIGTSIAPGYGTAIGAAIGLGLGVIKADQNKKANAAAREAKSQEILAAGLKDASQEMLKKQFRFGTSANRSTYSSKRNLK